MRDVFIGIDLGTTVLKAAAFDGRTGKALAVAGRRLPVETGSDGRREQSPRELAGALWLVLAALRRALGGDRWGAVAGIGMAAQGGSTCIVDRETGAPHTPLILWSDMRGFPFVPQVSRGRPLAYWRRHTMRDMPCMGLARLLWLRQRQPRLFRPSNCYAGAGELLFFQLTGTWRQDAGNALQTGCYHAARRELDPELLAIVGLDESFVAPMRRDHELQALSPAAARRAGLPAGIPVAGPYMDHEAGYLSAAGIGGRPLQCSLGTAWVGNVMLSMKAKWKSSVQLVLPGVTGPGWLVVQPLLAGNLGLDWALGQFLDTNHGRALDRMAVLFREDLLPPAGLVALPWLYRANPVQPDVVGAGTVIGMSASTTREDIFKAVAVSLPFELARVFDAVRLSRGVDCVVLGGGASKSAALTQLIGALFDPLPVVAYEERDLAGARGTVYALNRTVAKARISRAVQVDPRVRDRVRTRFEQYVKAVHHVYGKSADATGLVIG